jgi:hypothetical protein
MKKECEYCSAPNHPVGGSNDFIDEAPDCECDLEKQVKKSTTHRPKYIKITVGIANQRSTFEYVSAIRSEIMGIFE